jgi:hypothetical protein
MRVAPPGLYRAPGAALMRPVDREEIGARALLIVGREEEGQ